MTVAQGTFEVKLTPGASEPGVSRMSIDKTFEGDLVGTSRGEMLAVSTDVEGSAAYVAIEVVNGTLGGRTGTFALQHTGSMERGTAQLTITVVPDSGTAELSGLSGSMTIDVVEDKHLYTFDHTIGASEDGSAPA